MHTSDRACNQIIGVIGPGGKVIRSITEQTGCKIDLDDSGIVTIASADGEAAQKAVAIIRGITEEAEVGKIYTGKVVRITDFGAFPDSPGQGRTSPHLADRRDPDRQGHGRPQGGRRGDGEGHRDRQDGPHSFKPQGGHAGAGPVVRQDRAQAK